MELLTAADRLPWLHHLCLCCHPSVRSSSVCAFQRTLGCVSLPPLSFWYTRLSLVTAQKLALMQQENCHHKHQQHISPQNFLHSPLRPLKTQTKQIGTKTLWCALQERPRTTQNSGHRRAAGSNNTAPDALLLAKLVCWKATLEVPLCGGQQQFLSPSAAPRRAFKLLGQQPRATRTEADSSDSKVACFTLSGTGFIFAAPTTSKTEEWVARINAGTRWTEVSEDTKSRGHRIPVLGVPAPALAEYRPEHRGRA